jgi:hypothetical protein
MVSNAPALNRELLVALLELTKDGPVQVEDLRSAARVTTQMFDQFLEGLRHRGLVHDHDGSIEVSSEQRTRIAIMAVEAGSDIERVSRALGWLEFEEMASHAFEENGYEVSRRFRFKANGRRWEVDVLAARRPLVVCAECKRWARGMSGSSIMRTVEAHVEKVRTLSENLVELSKKLGLDDWRRGVVIPIALSLTSVPIAFHRQVPVVSIFQLPRFIADLGGHLDEITHFEVEIPPGRSKLFQTRIRS